MDKINPLEAIGGGDDDDVVDGPMAGQTNLVDELVAQGLIHPDAAQQLLDAGQTLDDAKECDISVLGGQFTSVDFDPDQTPVGTPVEIRIKGYVRQIGPKLMAGTGLRYDAKIQRTAVTIKATA